MELDYYTVSHIDEFNLFVQTAKKEGSTIVPVSVVYEEPSDKSRRYFKVFFYYAP